MDNLYYNPKDDPDLGDGCLVHFETGTITVKYDYDGEPVIWRGTARGTDHFELHSPEVDGRATLHRFPEGNVLIGEWIENGEKGMWRIELVE